MPRKHPQDKDKPKKSSFSALQERREARAERRRRKSSDSGVGNGILSTHEVEILTMERDTLQRKYDKSPSETLEKQIKHLNKELSLDSLLKQ